MEKVCPYCEREYQTSFEHQIACHRLSCKQQHISKRMRKNHLSRTNQIVIEGDLEDCDRSTFSGFLSYMRKRPFYFEMLSSMDPTPENIKEYFHLSV